jgi:glycerol uptake facilitator-like aquaporin
MHDLNIPVSCRVQIIGAIFGSLLAAGLLPGKSIGMGNGGPGCFDDTTISPDITRSQLFGWEVMMTFTLISVVYACGIAEPGHGSFTPLVVGLSLVTCAMTGESVGQEQSPSSCCTMAGNQPRLMFAFSGRLRYLWVAQG